MPSTFDEIPIRIFLDSCTLQALQTFGAYLFENEPIPADHRIHRQPDAVPNLEALRSIMQIAQRAPFQFALSEHSFAEVERRQDPQYLQWACDVLQHWDDCVRECEAPAVNRRAVALVESEMFNYLGTGDRVLLQDALRLGCDTFLTVETKLPKNAEHIEKTLGIKIFSPVEMWTVLRPWAALFL